MVFEIASGVRSSCEALAANLRVVLLSHRGRTVPSRSYGMADRERGIRNHEGIASSLSSAGKPFGAVAILQLAQRGELSLSDTVGAHLKGYAKDIAEQVTIHHLLSGTSGLYTPDVLGQTPIQYLTDWRMALARDHLRTGELGMTSIARSVGYGSPYAFAAAFRRHHGEPPGAWRQRESLRTPAVAGDDPHVH
ncbi:serine hydrolase [Streptacidiphilus sp. EB129]|uniref:serine hydrolase n=1 Tax=Streptacidiphilus sp. EB129 TaxID=3156262 RepID=UPI003518EF3A